MAKVDCKTRPPPSHTSFTYFFSDITSDTSHQKNKTVTIVESGNNHLDASTYSCATDPSSSSTPLFKKQKTSLEISSGATSISNFNDSAVDAAITVALQLITHSSSAEQILQVC